QRQTCRPSPTITRLSLLARIGEDRSRDRSARCAEAKQSDPDPETEIEYREASRSCHSISGMRDSASVQGRNRSIPASAESCRASGIPYRVQAWERSNCERLANRRSPRRARYLPYLESGSLDRLEPSVRRG